MNKKVVGIIVVVAVVLAAAVGILTLGNSNDDKTDNGSLVGNVYTDTDLDNESDCRVWVFGNATEDDYLDTEDVSWIKEVLKGNAESNLFCDANADGVVDQDDVEYLQGIISGDDTVVYYIDNYYAVAKVSWPVTSIAIGYCSGAYVADVTGLCEKVDMVDSTISTYWYFMNSNFASATSFGATETPDYEAMIAADIDVYVVGYCDANADSISPSKLNPAGIDVMFMSTADNSGVDYPNEHIDRAILMFALLLQGDMDKTYEYLEWHDSVLSKLESAASALSDDDEAAFMMARSSPSYDTDGYISITGYNNTNNLHAGWVGVYAIGQHSSYLTSNYNNLTAEQILTVISENSKDNTVYYMDNEHDGMRGQRDLTTCILADIEMLKNSTVNIHYMGMAREAGNSPLYVVELAFYQNVMYPQLSAVSGLDYRELFDYYFDTFASEDYSSHVDIDSFFLDYGVA